MTAAPPARSGAAAACALLLLVPCGRAARADIRVEIEGVDAELRRNVAALLSVERYKDRERIEPDAVERLYRRVDQEVRDALRPYGYYQPKVTSALETLDRERSWRVRIAIETGLPVLIDQVNVVVRGPGTLDPNFTRLTSSLPIKTGDRLLHPAYERIKTDLQRTANTYGYLDARMLRSELQVDPTVRKASIFLEMETGGQYHFGPTTIEQNAIRESRVRRFLQYREGEPFDASKWLRTQFALDDSQYFSTVEVALGERDSVNRIVPMQITALPSRRSYPFTIGWGSNDKLRGSVGWFNPRVNTLGHRLRTQLRASAILRSADAAYDVPLSDPAREKMSLAATIAERKPSQDVRTQELSLKPSITHVLGRWQRILSVNVAHTETETLGIEPTNQVDDLIVPGIVYASVPEGYLGENLFSRSFYAELVGSHNVLGANVDFLRLDLQAERSFNLRPGWHLLLRGEVGASAVAVSQQVPGQYQYFAGGDRSVRGFAYGELSPYDIATTTDPATGLVSYTKINRGGRHLITGTVEIERDLPRNFGIAAFCDFGNAIDSFGDPLAYSAGLGFRWRLPGITLGIDVAKSIKAPGFDSGTAGLNRLPGPRFHLNISPRF